MNLKNKIGTFVCVIFVAGGDFVGPCNEDSILARAVNPRERPVFILD